MIGLATLMYMLSGVSACDTGATVYEFVFEKNGGTIENEETILDRDEFDGTLPIPTKAGYAFAGWYFDQALSEPFTTDGFDARYEREGDAGRMMHLYAKWLPLDVDVTVEYYREGIDGVYYLRESETILGATGIPVTTPVPTYDFYQPNTGHPDWLATGTPMPEAPLVLRLYYERMAYAINFNVNGGTEKSSITIKFSFTFNVGTPPTKEGYVFDGWYNERTLTSPCTLTWMPSRDIDLYAKWLPLPRDLVFVENGGADLDDQLIEVGTAVTPPVPSRTGYAFGGWYADAECTTSPFANGTSMPDAAVTLYAKWTIRQYTIYFQENGGSERADLTLDFESAIQLPEAPMRAHYVFAGWFIDEALRVQNPYVTMTPHNFNLYAKWDPKMVTMSFVTNGAAAIDPLVVPSGASYALPSPEFVDHIFAGWFSDETLSTRFINDGVMPDENLTLYAAWYGMTYMIHFDTMGGPYVQDLSLPSGSPLSLPTPTRNGFTFVGWYDAMLTTPYTGTVMPEENLVLYAKWAPV